MKIERGLLYAVLVLMVVGCKVGPDYDRPDYPLPDAFRDAEQEMPADADPQPTFGDVEWFQVFDDPVLQSLIRHALTENYDLRIAAERVLEARSRVKITRADLFPDIAAGATYNNSRLSENIGVPAGIDRNQDQISLLGDLRWEIDFWGRIRSATDAARAELFATELGRRFVIQTLVCDLALTYFDLLELDEELRITQETYTSRQRSFDLVSLRLDQGVANKVEYRQSESLVLSTAALLPDLERRIAQQENLVRFLIGGNPGDLERGSPLLEQRHAVAIPSGLPADLLQRRPDVVAAEQGLIAANARIGEARALLFPTLSLTATGGVMSADLDDLVTGGSDFWNVTPSLFMPIFNAGRLRSNVAVTESQMRQATLGYQQSIQIALREVADALIERLKLGEVRGQFELLEETLRDQVSLSNDRYLGGVTSYLEVLDSERDYFDSQLQLVRSIRDELFAYVLLYRALGGGWQGAEALAAAGVQSGPSAQMPAR